MTSEAVKEVLSRFRALLKQADHDRRRALLQALVRHIDLTEARDIGGIETYLSDDVRPTWGASATER